MFKITTSQIARLLEIERVRIRKGGQGLFGEVEALISRVNSDDVGIKPDMDLRTAQAKVLWDKGWGKELGFETFEDYLATIPEVPEFPPKGDELFDRVILVDMRVTSLTRQCQLLGIKFNGSDNTFSLRKPSRAKTEVYWIYCQEGKRNQGKISESCRKKFAFCEIGASALEGLAIFAQDPTVIDGHIMDLPGSIRPESPVSVARFGCWKGEYLLDWADDYIPHPGCGSVSRQNC